ncbi:endonuclease-reverse transcriptase [Elysia marginata]|uniref:Endonuclease-reverse transcriptase n=1 Tax=Elysia marginata TaxID=1093978 RepID=A0AAV4IP65_9GAST|nr:endonuclease-reverse transcriptase [Elysia marginata]
MLHKGGNIKDCSNYRTIALISHSSKVLLIIILNRLKSKIEQELSDCQAGYRINGGTIDILFVLQILTKKVRISDQEMYITFIDYSKAFDSVKHNHLFKTMNLMGFPKHLIKLISGLYSDQRATIRWDDKKCEFFNITKGVRQGCILSPHLFNIYTEQIMREADIDQLGVNINGRNLTNLRYADDTALMSDNITSMRRILHRVDESGKKAGLKLNAKKTKVMQLKPENSSRCDVKIAQTVLVNVEDFKYLGSVKTIDVSCSKDIKMRIGMAKKKMIELNNVWKDHNIPIELKLKLLKCLIWPVMMYGCEAWSQKKDDDKRIEAAEMWFYRRILRVKWTDKRTNESVLKELKTERTLFNLINARKLKYVGHALRNHRTSLMNTVCEGRLNGRRRKGKPPMSLLTNLTTACGLSLHQIVQKSQAELGDSRG